MSIAHKESQGTFTKTSSALVGASLFLIFLFDFFGFFCLFVVAPFSIFDIQNFSRKKNPEYMLTYSASQNPQFPPQWCSPSSHAQLSCGNEKLESIARLCGSFHLPVPCLPQSQPDTMRIFYRIRTEFPMSSQLK